MSLSIDNGDVLVSDSSVDVHPGLNEGDLLDLLLGKSLLVHQLGVDYGLFVGVWEVDLEQHEASAVSVGLVKLLIQSLLQLVTDQGSLLPVLGADVVACVG